MIIYKIHNNVYAIHENNLLAWETEPPKTHEPESFILIFINLLISRISYRKTRRLKELKEM